MRASRFFLSLAVLFASSLSCTTAPAQGSASPTAAANPLAPTRKIGGAVSSPSLLSGPAPEFSEQARAQKFGGVVLVQLVVDAFGQPQNIHVLRGVGMGLDEKAMEAVRQYRFKPAMEAGKPVPVQLNIEVNFQIKDKPTAAPVPPRPAYEADPKYIAAIADAKRYTNVEELTFAADAFRKANKIAGGQCYNCLDQAIDLDLRMADGKAAVKDAQALLPIASTPVDKSAAQTLLGRALLAAAGSKPKPDQFQAIHQAFTAALDAFPANVTARFLDGQLLARMGQMDAARAQFLAALASARPSDPAYIRASKFAANPAISNEKMAPAFTVTALDGSRFTLDAMGGRVVLIDFWATWCGPCNEELPQMKKIAKDFAGQPLVILSISWDDNESTWKTFLTKHEMTWAQYRDADHTLTKLFGIDAIPHYFTIDSDGVLTAELVGDGHDVEGRLKKLVAHANATQPTSPAPQLTSAPPQPAATVQTTASLAQ